MRNQQQNQAAGNRKKTGSNGFYAILFLAIIVAILFWRSFQPAYVFFSNDGPLGVQNAAWQAMPGGITGMWEDLNYLGNNAGTITPDVTALLHLFLKPLGYAKFYPVIALFILGLGAWTLFRQLKLSPLAAFLGALAAMLNSTFFSAACWGVASQEIAAGMDFFAVALVVGCHPGMTPTVRWARLALAGFCVGVNVMEAADIGALYSIMVALFVFFHALFEGEGSPAANAVRGVARVAIIAICAIFIAFQAVVSLVGTQVQGVAGTGQDTETKAAHWDWATQWSLPKSESLGLLVPGLFGYKMDTPANMQPLFGLSLEDAYANGAYWGIMGQDPNITRWLDAGAQGPQPQGFMRFTGGGNYCGILVLLVAGWAIAQSLRRKNSVFPDRQRRMIQFLAVLMLLCLLLSWGRFAPFYAVLYQLPYFSTIRNPAKFLNWFSWALVILFAYGVHALNRQYLDPAAKTAGLGAQLKNWWPNAPRFDRIWAFATVGLVALAILGWNEYDDEKPAAIAWLHKLGFGGDDPSQQYSAAALVAFSLGQLVWFLWLFGIAVVLLWLVIAGFFNGPRARLGMTLLFLFLLFDLGRANLPWLVDWNYRQKYEVGSLDPIVKFLRDKPYENRVAYAVPAPLQTPAQWEKFDELYKIEWIQQLFPYYNIQSLDIVQMPRAPEDMMQYEPKFQIQARPAPGGGYEVVPETFQLVARRWQLTNTRYLLGPAPFVDELNQAMDPVLHRFSIVSRFDLAPKPGISIPSGVSPKDYASYLPPNLVTPQVNTNGDYALIEFEGALPRAKVYSNWQVNTNDEANLDKLADLKFDPAKTVLVSTPEPGLPLTGTNEDSGSVQFKSYQTTDIILSASNAVPSVLLLNDRFDPDWTVTVDGKAAPLLRCNFIMRGVYLPTAGVHTVRFEFHLPHKPLYVTLAAIALALGLCGFLAFAGRSRQTARL